MPYSFVEIEKEKSWVIKAVFVFLTVFYFLVAQALWIITKALLLTDPATFKPPFNFPVLETAIVFFIALAAACVHWYFSTRDMIPTILFTLGAISPDPKDTYHRVFKNVVEEVSVATGGRHIDCYIMPSSGTNAFSASDFQGNSMIGVTEGLLARLSRSQLEAVVGHEAAHIASGDSFMTAVTCSLFGVYAAMLEGVRRPGRIAGRLGLYIVVVYIVLSVVKGINYLLKVFISRQKEYRADAAAVRLTRDPLSLSEALYIISRGWRGVGAISNSLAPLFIISPELSVIEESGGFLANLLSTHPPVNRRLNVLLDMAHSDVKTLVAGIKAPAKIPFETGITPIIGEPQKEWLVYKENRWQGPFALEYLISQGLNPLWWVSNINDSMIRQAREDKFLNEVLKKKIDGKNIKENNLCPNCNEPLMEVLYEGAPVLKCYYCAGIFAERNIVTRIMAREKFEFPQEIKTAAATLSKKSLKSVPMENFKVANRLICPKCENKMWRGLFSYGVPVEVDICYRCDRIWFDKHELEILQCIIERNRRWVF